MFEFIIPSLAVLPNRHSKNQTNVSTCWLFMHFESFFCQYVVYLSKFENLISHFKMKIIDLHYKVKTFNK